MCVTLLLEYTCNMYIVSLLEYYSAVKGIAPPPTWMDFKNHILNHVVLSEKSVLKGHTVCFHFHGILRITKP